MSSRMPMVRGAVCALKREGGLGVGGAVPADVAELQRLDGGPPEVAVRVPAQESLAAGHGGHPLGPGRVRHVAQEQARAEVGGAALVDEAAAQGLGPFLGHHQRRAQVVVRRGVDVGVGGVGVGVAGEGRVLGPPEDLDVVRALDNAPATTAAAAAACEILVAGDGVAKGAR
jgi:hypothetical protein